MNAEITRIFPIVFNDYFKKWMVRFKVVCPFCHRVNRHGQELQSYPERLVLKGSRSCDVCGADYDYEWRQNVL